MLNIYTFRFQKHQKQFSLGIAFISPVVHMLDHMSTVKQDTIYEHEDGSELTTLFERDAVNSAHEKETKKVNGTQIKNKYLKMLQSIQPKSPSALKWVSFMQNGVISAEVLISADFIQLPSNLQITEEKSTSIVGIPKVICPTMTNYKYIVQF